MRKTRPVVIVGLDVLNAALNTVVVCPLTTRIHAGWRSRLQIQVKGKNCEIAVDQIRAIAKERLGHRIQSLTGSEAAALRRLLTEMYGEA